MKTLKAVDRLTEADLKRSPVWEFTDADEVELDVFPIHYDIRRLCKGDPAALAGSVEKRPKERLTRSQIIGLAVPPRVRYKGW